MCLVVFFSELAQKNQAEREAKRALHEAGVAKKKEIIAHSIAIKSERQVDSIPPNFSLEHFGFCLETFESIRRWSTSRWKRIERERRQDIQHLLVLSSIFVNIDLKRQAEAPEKEAKDKHQKLWDGLLELLDCEHR